MSRALLLLYLIVEITAFVAVAQWIGFGWAILALGGLFLAGVVAAAWEMRRLTARAMADAIAAQEAMGHGAAGRGGTPDTSDPAAAVFDPTAGETEARKALASAGTLMVDSAMLMVGCLLLALPGFVSTVIGLALILPPTKWLIRKIGGASLGSWFQRTGSKSMFVVQQYGVKYGDDGAEIIDHDAPTAPAGSAGPGFSTDDASAPRRLGRGTGERINFDVPDDLSELDDWARKDENRRGGRKGAGASDDGGIDERPDDGVIDERPGDGPGDKRDGGNSDGAGPEPRA